MPSTWSNSIGRTSNQLHPMLSTYNELVDYTWLQLRTLQMSWEAAPIKIFWKHRCWQMIKRNSPLQWLQICIPNHLIWTRVWIQTWYKGSKSYRILLNHIKIKILFYRLRVTMLTLQIKPWALVILTMDKRMSTWWTFQEKATPTN